MRLSIDVNADVGEGVGNESQLMPFLSSCNIACGGHAGDEESMRYVVKLALEHNVKIGAHPSYPDKKNFGRNIIDISTENLYDSLKSQVLGLMTICREFDLQMHHIKPHGALYNLAAKDVHTANVILDVMISIGKSLKLYAPYNSVIAKRAKQEKIPLVYEAFADRNYNVDLSLVSREHKQALITKYDAVFEHIYHMIQHGKVKTLNGVEVPIKASTYCIHSDTENAAEIVEFLSQKLKNKMIEIR